MVQTVFKVHSLYIVCMVYNADIMHIVCDVYFVHNLYIVSMIRNVYIEQNGSRLREVQPQIRVYNTTVLICGILFCVSYVVFGTYVEDNTDKPDDTFKLISSDSELR